jgi:predicted metal-dependent phosphotriesterase family hydrolase
VGDLGPTLGHELLPALLEAGVTQEHIDQMLIANPRNLFAR